MSFSELWRTRSVLLEFLVLGAGTVAAGETGFLDKAVVVDGTSRGYALYVPDNYDPAKAWPLIVFLHGKGEQGDDNLKQTEVGIGRAIRLNRDWFPALVLMPQCPKDRFWDAAIPTIEAAMAQTRANYTIDSKAITLTGLSLGGYATWIWGSTKTDTFAALMPICGGGNLLDLKHKMPIVDDTAFGSIQERVSNLRKVPIWAFHGEDDSVVPAARSRYMVERIEKAGGKIRYKEFKNTGHNSWDKAYGYKRAIVWLLKQRKK